MPEEVLAVRGDPSPGLVTEVAVAVGMTLSFPSTLRETEMTATVATPPEGQVLQECLERIVRDVFGSGSAITAVQRKRSQYSSFYGSDVLTVRLEAGGEVQVFLKDFGSHERVKEGMKERREREVAVYRDLLPGAGLGTARYYGSHLEESEGRLWLFLELVPGVPVAHSPFEHWVAAAGWLGRKDAYFTRQAALLEQNAGLIHHDADYFLVTARKALDTSYEVSTDFGRLMEPLVARYPRAVEAMVNSQPRTLVHGTYRPIQLILDLGQQPPRLCPVDWEKAGVGSCFFDLAFLADGFDPVRLAQLFEAYRGAAEEGGLQVCGPEEMKYLVDCHRLHRVMNWISVCLERSFPEHKVAKLRRMAEEIGQLVLGE
jgi:Phosphotransferase enzyme family